MRNSTGIEEMGADVAETTTTDIPPLTQRWCWQFFYSPATTRQATACQIHNPGRLTLKNSLVSLCAVLLPLFYGDGLLLTNAIDSFIGYLFIGTGTQESGWRDEWVAENLMRTFTKATFD